MSIPSLKLTKETVGPIARGHPWVYEDGIHERPPVGTIVRLVDHRNKTVAFGLMDEGPIAVRVLGRFPVDLSTLLRARFQTALHERSALLPPNTTAYRLINGAGDGLPGLVADRYGPVIILRLYKKY